MSELQLQLNRRCFGCGPDNPRGLHMRMERCGDEFVSRLTVPEHVQGWADIAHGGFLCTVMDEVMAWAVRGTQCRAVTARLNARFRVPVAVGARITVRGRVVRRRGRIINTRAVVELQDGTVAAEAEGSFITVTAGGG